MRRLPKRERQRRRMCCDRALRQFTGGIFDGALEPVLTVDSGDRVIVESVSGNPEWMPPQVDRIRDSARTQGHPSTREAGHRQSYPHRTDLRARRGDRRCARGADPRYRAASELGLQPVPGLYGHAAGGLPLLPAHSCCARPEEQHGASCPRASRCRCGRSSDSSRWPRRRMFGRQNSKEPREFGGNLDCKELTAGSTIYLPVWNEGAPVLDRRRPCRPGRRRGERHRDRDRAQGHLRVPRAQGFALAPAARGNRNAPHHLWLERRSRRCRASGVAAR